MRKIAIIMLILLTSMYFACGKSENSTPQGDQNRPGTSQDQKRPSAKPGASPSSKGQQPGGEIDIDKLDIPDQMKEAIKSGRIPMDRVREYLASQQEDAPVVNVQTVGRKNLNSYLVLNGVVEPERTVEVFARLSAYVKNIIKEEGDYVRANDVLAQLDDQEILISYQQAKIQLEQAKLSLEEAEANFNRSQELIKKDLISEQEYQTTESAYNQRKLDYDNRMESFKNLELQLDWTKIRALSDGYITERLIEVGSKVNQNQQVYTIEDFSPLLIRVYVPSSDAIKLETGMTAEVTTNILEGKIFTGNIKLINPRIDSQTGTIKVTVEVYDETLQLKPGMFVEVKIIIGMKENILVIPRKAILFKQNKTYVFVMDQGRVSQREVILGLTEEDEVEITEGLNEGEVIVTVGVEALKDGQQVRVVR